MAVQFGEDTGPDREAPPSLLSMAQDNMAQDNPSPYWAAADRPGGVDANSLLGYLTDTFGDSQPARYTGNDFTGMESEPHPYTYPMTGDAKQFMSQQKFPVDPARIQFGGSRFTLDNDPNGPDIFGGKYDVQTMPLSQMPRELQPLLAPSLVRFYKDQNYSTGAGRGQMSAPWTRFFAPPQGVDLSGVNAQFGSTWPGITRLDPWGRSMGEFTQPVYT